MSDDSDDEKLNFDFSKLKNFLFSKSFAVIVLILLLLVPIIYTVYIRLQPQDMPMTYNWAENSVTNYYKNSIAQQVNTQYPNLPQANKDTIINQQFAEYKKNNQAQIDTQIKQTGDYFKTGFQYSENNKTWTFLGDLDSYYYLREARNLVENGYTCDEMRNGVCWDNHLLAPVGGPDSLSMHPLGIFVLYKILKIFSPSITLMRSSFLLPMVIACIAAIAAFFLGRKLMNSVAGFFAAMFVALSPIFITRTLGSDTDVWNVMFPLLILWIFTEAYESKNLIKRYSLLVLTTIIFGVFSFAWGGGWWYIFDFILASLFSYLAFLIVKNIYHKQKIISKEIVTLLLTMLVLIVGTGIFVTLFVDFGSFTNVALAPTQLFSGLKAAAHSTLWPNVYTTVAELNEASIPTIIAQISYGMNLLFAAALLGIIFSMIKRKPDVKEYILISASIIFFIFLTSATALKYSTIVYLSLMILPSIIGVLLVFFNKHSDGHGANSHNVNHKDHDNSKNSSDNSHAPIDIKLAILLTIWFVGMMYASVKGVRFILLLTPAFAVAFGVTIGYVYQYLVRVLHSNIKLSEILSKAIVFAVLCLILINPIKIGIDSGKGYMPSMTKGWWDSLTKIREQSKPDAIINSWWDFGHWFKFVADRKVSLDGGTQNHPNAHWLGKILQTNNENESVAILRMLDCGSNNAFEELNKKYSDTEKSQNVISKLILLSKNDASDYLDSLGFSQSEINSILALTHCNPPEDYFITSEDMVGKAGVWAHFGLWDFDKAFIINEVKPKPMKEAIKIMQDRFNYSYDDAAYIYDSVRTLTTDREMNDWISPWPSYISGNVIQCNMNSNKLLLCPINMGIGNTGQGTAVVENALINISNPASSEFTLTVIDSAGRRLGSEKQHIKKLVMLDNESKSYDSTNSTIPIGIMINVNTVANTSTYSAILADPLLVDSTFSKLFFFDGKGTTRFEKFSDVTDITGTRIIIWKVKW